MLPKEYILQLGHSLLTRTTLQIFDFEVELPIYGLLYTQ